MQFRLSVICVQLQFAASVVQTLLHFCYFVMV